MKSYYTNGTRTFCPAIFSLLFLCCVWVTGSAQTTIAQWNFNSNPADANTGTGLTSPSIGSGTASLAGGSSATFASGDANGGSTDPASGDDSGWNVSTFPAQNTGDRSRGAQFLVNTTGFENLQVRWDQRHSNTAPRHVQLQYTTNGGSTWTDFGNPFEGTAGDTWFNNRNADLSAITAANDNPNFGIRIVAAFAPNTSAYTASNTGSNYSTSGTWRLDMVTVAGTPACVDPEGTLSNSGPVCPSAPVSLTFNATLGVGPFSLLVNGIPYDNVNSGEPFVTLTEGLDFSGNTTFTLTEITDANHCSATGLNAQTEVMVNAIANTSISATPNPVGQGAILNLSVASAGSGASYNWSGSGVSNNNANITTAIPAVGGAQVYAVTVTNASNCVATGSVTVTVVPAVTLSLSANNGSESSGTTITVTATASAPVTGNQSVSLLVSGAGITSGDYYLSKTTISILSGQTSGSVTFTIADDAVEEATETAVLSLASPSAGIGLGTPSEQSISIQDNACSFLIKKGAFSSTNGAEIPAFDPASMRVFVVAGSTIEILSLDNGGALSLIGSLPIGFTPPGGTAAIPNSVAVYDGVVAVSYAIQNTSTNAQEAGRVAFYTAATGAFLNVVTTGALPDMIAFSPDGQRLLSADEGEPNSYGQGNSVDPEGSVSIVDLSGGIMAATVQVVGFASFNPQIAALRAAGVRIYGPGATVAQDLEPEYLAFSPDGLTARVTLQENNAIAVLDIASATFTSIQPLGLKDHNTAGNGLDASDQDGGINIQQRPVYGMYQPDAIAGYTVNGQTYYITANEGDSRDYTGFSEEVRVGSGSYVLDPTAFPNAAALKANNVLGRLQLTNATGNTDGDGDFDQIHALGARSFSIWNESGVRVYDSGDQIEQITSSKSPALFNSDGVAASFDGRSDNKGPEPEGVAIGNINGVNYAFIGLERTGDIMVYDVSNPASAEFVQYINIPEDRGVEGLVFVPATKSPTGAPLLITTAEVSRSVTVYEITVPTLVCPADQEVAITGESCSALLGNQIPVALSDCTFGPTFSQSPATSTLLSGHNTIQLVTLTAHYANGDIETCAFNVTLKDTAKPGISCPADKVVAATTACNGLLGVHTALSVSDNCSGAVGVTQSPASSTILSGHGALQVVTLTANDGNGNTQTCQFNVTLQDQRKPTLVCPSAKTLDAGADCSAALGAWLPAALSDNCTANPVLTQSPASTTLLQGHNSVETVTLSATDDAGNTRSCTFKVTLKDKAKPTLSCPADLTIQADASCQAEIGEHAPSVLTDNCTTDPDLVQVPHPTAMLIGQGANQVVTLSATDAVGNLQACTFLVTLACPSQRPGENKLPVVDARDLPTNESVELEIIVYPNPNSGVFTVEVPGAQEANYLLYDALGREVLQRTGAAQQVINIEDLPNGVYALWVKTEGAQKNVRVIVQH